MTHLTATDDVLEAVSLYVLGALPGDERAAFERHLTEGCPTCEREVATLAATVGELGRGAPAGAPRPEVRARLLARLASQATIVRAGAGRWEHDPRGLEVCRLHRNATDARVTSLVRMAPGVRYPGHRHASTEELYMLAGDLTVEGERLGAGDYCAAAPGTIHRETVSDGGCTFVLVTSEQDEILSGPGAWTAPGTGLTFVRAAAGDWRPGLAPGVQIRRLYHDRTVGAITGLVRMVAGAHLPNHRRIAAEQIYMLAGDAYIGGETLEAGDYYRAPAGASHDITHTERGCEFLLISSTVEILDS